MGDPMARVAFETPFGRIGVAATDKGVVRIDLPGSAPVDVPESTDGQAARGARLAAQARREIIEYLAGRRRTFTVPVSLAGVPPFHARVLRAARRIPYGRTMTYGQLAAAVGQPRGARAVGQAMARNPVPLIFPCHRVTARAGLGGYGGGLDLKRRLLDREGGKAGSGCPAAYKRRTP
jgi:methylated-DNA-[protein]-cysteine S-methyltransferase